MEGIEKQFDEDTPEIIRQYHEDSQRLQQSEDTASVMSRATRTTLDDLEDDFSFLAELRAKKFNSRQGKVKRFLAHIAIVRRVFGEKFADSLEQSVYDAYYNKGGR